MALLSEPLEDVKASKDESYRRAASCGTSHTLSVHKGAPALCPPPDSAPFFPLNRTITAMSPLIFSPGAVIVFKLPDSVRKYERRKSDGA